MVRTVHIHKLGPGRLARPWMILVSLWVSAGCAGVYDWQEDTGHGSAQIYQASFDEVWNSLPGIVGDVGLDFVDDDREDRLVVAERKTTGASYGERVAIVVRPVSASETWVKVNSKRVRPHNLLAANWEGPILEQLDARFSRRGESPPGATETTQSP